MSSSSSAHFSHGDSLKFHKMYFTVFAPNLTTCAQAGMWFGGRSCSWELGIDRETNTRWSQTKDKAKCRERAELTGQIQMLLKSRKLLCSIPQESASSARPGPFQPPTLGSFPNLS